MRIAGVGARTISRNQISRPMKNLSTIVYRKDYMRVKVQPYDDDNSLMVLVIPNHMLHQVGIDTNTELSIVFFEDEMRIYKTKSVKDMGVEMDPE